MTKYVGNMRPYKKGVGGFDKILMLLLYFDQNYGDDNALLDKGPTKSACCLGISIWLIHFKFGFFIPGFFLLRTEADTNNSESRYRPGPKKLW